MSVKGRSHLPFIFNIIYPNGFIMKLQNTPSRLFGQKSGHGSRPESSRMLLLD